MKYRVYGVMTASKFIGEFEANSAEEAEIMAMNSNENYASLCHQCTRGIDLADISFSQFEVEEEQP